MTTSVRITGAPGETVVVLHTPLLHDTRELARTTIADDGATTIVFTVSYSGYLLGLADLAYLVDGAPAAATVRVW